MKTIILVIVLFLSLLTNQSVYGKINSLYSLPQTSCNTTLSDTIEWCEGGLQGFWITGAQLPNQVRISDVWGNDTTFTLNSNYIPYTLFFPYVDNNGQSYLQITDLVNNCFDVFLVQPGIIDILPVYFLTNNVSTTPASCGLSNGRVTGMRVSPGSYNAGKWYDSQGNLMPSTPVYNNSYGHFQYDLNNVAAGTYTFIYESDCDYFETTATVEEQVLLFDTIFNSLQIYTDYCNPCASGAIIQQQPYYSIAWSTGATGFTTGFICPGDYSITLTYNNFETQATCSQTHNFTIDAPDTSVQIIGGTAANICGLPCQSQITDVIVANGTPPYQYLWSDGQTTLNAINLCEGLATLSVKDANNCIVTKTYTIEQSTPIFQIGAVSPPATCTCDGAVSVSVTGGVMPYTYLWSNGQTVANITNLCAGDITLSIQDANNCIVGRTYTIEQEISNLQTVIFSEAATCGCNGLVSIEATNGLEPYSYLWSDNSTQSSINSACSSLLPYVVTVTDANGCTQASSIILNNDTMQIQEVTSYQSVSCNCTGIVSLSLSGGTSPFTYQWSDGSTQSNLYNACGSQAYQVTITDNNGCTKIQDIVTQAPYTINISDTHTTSECNLCNASINATITPNSQAISYSYQWSNSANTLAPYYLCAGNYTLVATDNFGCTYTHTITIEDVSPDCNDNNPNTEDILDSSTCSCYHEIVGIETANFLNIAITPNPARNYLNVSSNTNGLLELYNITGLIVLQQELSVGEQQIETNNLPDGIYICQIKTDKQVLNRQKVVLLRQ